MNKNKTISSLLFSFVGFLISLIAFPFIEGQLIVHWSSNNVLNLDKIPYLFIIPLISLFLSGLIIVISFLDKFEKNRKNDINVYFALTVLLAFIANVSQVFLISSQFGFSINFNFVFYLGVGMLISFIGNYLPKLRPTRINFLLHRLWVNNPKQAVKSLRLRGYSLFASGIMIMLCSLIDNFVGATYAVVLSISILILTLLVNYVYTYMKILRRGSTA